MDFEKAKKLLEKSRPAIEDAGLRLALLKENFEYRRFFSEFKNWIKENENLEVWPGLRFDDFGLRLRFFISNPSYETILKAVDPFEEDPPNIDNYLPNLFYDPSVVLMNTGSTPWEGHSMKPLGKKYASWQRLYLVDLRKNKKQIETEFRAYLDWAFQRKKDTGHDPSYDDWETNNSRRREEAWRHLEVWKLRKQKKSFSTIAKTLKISEDTAKKSFYRAFELTQEEKYNQQALQEIQRIRKEEIKKTCATCPDRENCVTLCPGVLAYVNQDVLPNSKERLLTNDSDTLKDLLLLKKSH